MVVEVACLAKKAPDKSVPIIQTLPYLIGVDLQVGWLLENPSAREEQMVVEDVVEKQLLAVD